METAAEGMGRGEDAIRRHVQRALRELMTDNRPHTEIPTVPHRVFVIVEAYQAGLRDRRRHRVEPIEPAGIGNELWPFRLEHIPDRLLGQFWMAVRLGVGDAFIKQPGIQLVVGLEPQPRREEAFTDQPDLVLDLPLLPAGCRRAGDRIDEVMAAHLLESAIVETILADKDRLHRGLHVVVNTASAGALEQSKRPVVGVEHHLLRLARISSHEQHAAVTEPDMGGLYDHRRAIQQNDFVAPVELIGFSRRKAQGDIGCSRCRSPLFGPRPRIAADRVVAPVISAPAQLFEDPDQRQLFTGRLNRIACQQRAKLARPPAQLWSRLHLPLILKGRLARPQHPADRIPGPPKVPGDLLDRLALDKVLAPNPRNRLHDTHPPPPASLKSRQRNSPTYGGSILDADPPAQGVKIARRNTGKMSGGTRAILLRVLSKRWRALREHCCSYQA